jgi:DNA-binding Xre family transcriptional regulator
VSVDREDEVLVLLRGNLKPLVVPVAWFRRRSSTTVPDLGDCGITDWGHTLRLGDYEAAAAAILYDFDRDYRQRAKARAVELDRSFGGALRRLRLRRGLGRADFRQISAKEIARLERGEVAKPRRRTLRAIVKRLGVAPGEIQTF